MSTPHSAPPSPSDLERKAFADDVAYYLRQTPRQLPSRYLYDELGSSLFEAICRLPWYQITKTERRLLGSYAGEIFSRLEPVSVVVELGPGSGEKLVTLMAAHTPGDVSVHLIDVSAAALDKAARALGSSPGLAVIAHQATYEAGLSELRHPNGTNTNGLRSGRTLVVFLGSNIGNFDPPGVDAFLRSVRGTLEAGDALLLGTDLVKPERDLLLAYDDPLGVTAAFNRNLLVRANRELDADFDVTRFAHRAIWNAPASRVEMHLVSLERQHVHVRASQIDVRFDRGEPIWTESSYKYRLDDLAPMLARAGFRIAGQWTDDGFALTLAEGVEAGGRKTSSRAEA